MEVFEFSKLLVATCLEVKEDSVAVAVQFVSVQNLCGMESQLASRMEKALEPQLPVL